MSTAAILRLLQGLRESMLRAVAFKKETSALQEAQREVKSTNDEESECRTQSVTLTWGIIMKRWPTFAKFLLHNSNRLGISIAAIYCMLSNVSGASWTQTILRRCKIFIHLLVRMAFFRALCLYVREISSRHGDRLSLTLQFASQVSWIQRLLRLQSTWKLHVPVIGTLQIETSFKTIGGDNEKEGTADRKIETTATKDAAPEKKTAHSDDTQLTFQNRALGKQSFGVIFSPPSVDPPVNTPDSLATKEDVSKTHDGSESADLPVFRSDRRARVASTPGISTPQLDAFTPLHRALQHQIHIFEKNKLSTPREKSKSKKVGHTLVGALKSQLQKRRSRLSTAVFKKAGPPTPEKYESSDDDDSRHTPDNNDADDLRRESETQSHLSASPEADSVDDSDEEENVQNSPSLDDIRATPAFARDQLMRNAKPTWKSPFQPQDLLASKSQLRRRTGPRSFHRRISGVARSLKVDASPMLSPASQRSASDVSAAPGDDPCKAERNSKEMPCQESYADSNDENCDSDSVVSFGQHFSLVDSDCSPADWDQKGARSRRSRRQSSFIFARREDGSAPLSLLESSHMELANQSSQDD